MSVINTIEFQSRENIDRCKKSNNGNNNGNGKTTPVAIVANIDRAFTLIDISENPLLQDFQYLDTDLQIIKKILEGFGRSRWRWWWWWWRRYSCNVLGTTPSTGDPHSIFAPQGNPHLCTVAPPGKVGPTTQC